MEKFCRRGETFMSLIAYVLRRIWMWKRKKEIFWAKWKTSHRLLCTQGKLRRLQEVEWEAKRFSSYFSNGFKRKWNYERTSLCQLQVSFFVVVCFHISLDNPFSSACKVFFSTLDLKMKRWKLVMKNHIERVHDSLLIIIDWCEAENWTRARVDLDSNGKKRRDSIMEKKVCGVVSLSIYCVPISRP